MSAATAAWLIGAWLVMPSPTDRDLSHCGDGSEVRYAANGEYWSAEELGRWRIERDRLIETPIAAGDPGHIGRLTPGLVHRSRIERIGPDEMRLTFADGDIARLLRCPA